MEFIDIYDDIGQKSGKSEDKEEAHRKELVHRGGCVRIMMCIAIILWKIYN